MTAVAADQAPTLPGESGATAPPALASSRVSLWVCRALVAAAAILTFLPALKNQLLPWDDQTNIVQNPNLTGLLAAGLRNLWTAPYDGLYVPLVYTTYAAETALTRDEAALARLIHADNLLLHALAALLAFELLRRLLAATGSPAAHGAACAGALLFSVHPLQAEAVSWATGRKDLLAAVLSFAALLQYLRWRETGRPVRYVAALVCFLAALISKPAAAAVPLAALALDWYILRLPLTRSARALWPWAAAAGLFAWATARIQHAASHATEDVSTPLWARPFIAADSLVFYVEKTLLPLGFSPVYSRTADAVSSNTALLLIAGALAAGALAFLLTRRNLAGAAAAVAAALVLPASGIVPFHYQTISTVADRYAYAALLGAALGAAAVVRLLGGGSGRRRGLGTALLCAAVLIPLAVLSWNQSARWRSSETLWTHAARVAPGSAVVQNNLGMASAEAGRIDEAMTAFEAAVRLQPGFAAAHNNLANLYSAARRDAEAAEQYEKALAADPRHAIARENLTTLHLRAERLDEAAVHAGELLKHDPDHLVALQITAMSLGTRGQGQEALKLLREASARKPDNQELSQLLKEAEGIAATEALTGGRRPRP
ncbi:MAG: tetratricopeptide repeat protein [Pseudomonadota bacterium]|nr:tetratricopeptide repeat protein [Pseudomonadota bacterium]